MPLLLAALLALLYAASRLLETDRPFRPGHWHRFPDRNGPFFEGWYFKVVAPDRRTVLAVVPGVSFGRKGSANDTHAFVFFTVNGGDTQYYRYPIKEFRSRPGRSGGVQFRIGPNTFGDRGIDLRLAPRPGDAATATVSGALQFTNPVPWPVKWNSVGAMGWFGWLSFLECYHHVISLDHDVAGTLTTDGRSIGFDGGKGYTDKDWGTRFPSDWIWLQSNHFSGQPGSSLFFSIARIPLHVTHLPGFICGFWHQAERRLYRFATYTGARVTRLHLEGPLVSITIESRTHALLLHIHRSTAYALLYGPRGGKMVRHIPETLRAWVNVTLLQRRPPAVVFAAIGDPAGLEMVEERPGGLQWLKRALRV